MQAARVVDYLCYRGHLSKSPSLLAFFGLDYSFAPSMRRASVALMKKYLGVHGCKIKFFDCFVEYSGSSLNRYVLVSAC